MAANRGWSSAATRSRVGHRLEGRDLASFRLRVRHHGSGVLVEQLHPDGVVEDLTEGLVNCPRRAFRQPFAPRPDRLRVEPVDAGVPERVGRVPQPGFQDAEGVPFGGMLLEVLIDEVCEGGHRLPTNRPDVTEA
jgi:hypothetical protein